MPKQQKESKYIKKIVELHNHIESYINENELDKAFRLIDELKGICKTETYYVSLSTVYFNSDKLDKVKKVVDEGILEYPFAYSLHFNASIVEYMLGNYEKSFYHIGKSLRYATNSEQVEASEGNLNGIIQSVQQSGIMSLEQLKEQLLNVKKISKETDQRSYPIDQYGDSMIRKVRKLHTGEEVMVNMYKSYYLDNVQEITRFLSKVEMVKGQVSTAKKFLLKNMSTLPISFIDNVTSIVIKHNDDILEYNSGALDYKQFNYLTFDAGNVEIKSEVPLFIGAPISLDEERKPHRLVLHLFIDALSQTYLDDVGLKNAMPNTYAFFKDGYINENTYATAEWTLPSLASVCTGKYTVEHGLHHPSYPYDLSEKNKLLLTYIKEAGYYTAHFNNDWRSVPNYGYEQSFDRILYQNAIGGYEASEIIGEMIEHMETFKNSNNYIWLTLTDLHDVPDEIHKNLMGQVSLSAKYRTKKELGITSVRTSYDKNKSSRYFQELRRLDLHLATLFRYIQATYDKEEVLIILNSDHGQSFLAESPYNFMHKYRRKVPLMVYGKDIEPSVSNKLASNVDIYPTVLNLLGVKLDLLESLDGQVIEDFGGNKREYALTESYHPGQTYKAVIETDYFTLYYETVDEVDNYCKVDMVDYNIDVVIKDTSLDNQQLKDMVDYYEEFIIRKRASLQR